ncbi:MAG TPA: sigma-70 family RNA polymerase sigma factor [Candidatus Binatus sp.]|nr:sigma-70 family RNA polymerase sigma factor [Candidatus Binatus sp.]
MDVNRAHSTRAGVLEELFRAHERMLWRLSYRLTGSAADADDVVQETFVRLIERPPADVAESLRAWLVRVATNLGVDALRRRKRRAYPGAWLPSPIETEGPEWPPCEATAEGGTPEARYELLESVSFAFLLALEALSPRQRAVLLLCEVLDYSAREAAAAIGTTESNARIIHHRARRALAEYDRGRCTPTPESQERTRHALGAFMASLATQDARAIEKLLADSVRTVTDAAGEYTALAAPLVGRQRVARLYLRAAEHRRTAGARFAIRLINGLPGVVMMLSRPQRRAAPRTVLRCEVSPAGRITELHAILASRKLTAVRFERLP